MWQAVLTAGAQVAKLFRMSWPSIAIRVAIGVGTTLLGYAIRDELERMVARKELTKQQARWGLALGTTGLWIGSMMAGHAASQAVWRFKGKMLAQSLGLA